MTYAIGDIHGHLDKLLNLLLALADSGMTDDDPLVFVGDYIDRGPDSNRVIAKLIDLRDNRPNTVFLRGNHEQMMLDARERFDSSFDGDNQAGNSESGIYWFAEGGTETLVSYRPTAGQKWFSAVPDSHWDFILSTKLEVSIGGYLFVHAGVLPEGKRWRMDGFDADPRLWIRDVFHTSESNFGGKVVVFGHTPTRNGKPIILWNKVGIDTGAGFGGPLTAVGLDEPYQASSVIVIQA